MKYCVLISVESDDLKKLEGLVHDMLNDAKCDDDVTDGLIKITTSKPSSKEEAENSVITPESNIVTDMDGLPLKNGDLVFRWPMRNKRDGKPKPCAIKRIGPSHLGGIDFVWFREGGGAHAESVSLNLRKPSK